MDGSWLMDDGESLMGDLRISIVMGVPHYGWFISWKIPSMDDLGVPLFSETPMSSPAHVLVGVSTKS